MSERDPGRGPEYFAAKHVAATEPERLPPAAHAACEPPDEPDTDVELEDDEPSDHSGQYEV